MIGTVLAGGQSRRLGVDKALLTTASETLVERAARKLAAVCPTVVIADRGRGLAPPWPSIPDGPGQGPAAGLLGAALHRPGQGLLVLACDLPRVPTALLEALATALAPLKQGLPGQPGTSVPASEPPSEPPSEASELDLVVVETERGVEPLCAAYGPRALAVLSERVGGGGFALHPLATDPELRVGRLSGEELARFGDPAEMLLNLNRPEDLERWRALESESQRR